MEGGVGLRTQYSSRPHPVVSALISVSRVQQGPVVPACLAWDARSSPQLKLISSYLAHSLCFGVLLCGSEDTTETEPWK